MRGLWHQKAPRTISPPDLSLPSEAGLLIDPRPEVDVPVQKENFIKVPKTVERSSSCRCRGQLSVCCSRVVGSRFPGVCLEVREGVL